MQSIAIIGHFAFAHQCLDGQTIKTINLYQALEERLGMGSIKAIDTHNNVRFLLLLPFILVKTLYSAKNIIILPAQRGIKIITPILLFLNLFFKRKIHYVVIGGWLPAMIQQSKIVRYFVKRVDVVYVETQQMLEDLHNLAIGNTIVMPNFKNLSLRSLQEIENQKFNEPYSVCTFSRVSREKGIEEAINAIKDANNKLGRIAFQLDIYGQIEKEKDWFAPLIMKQPSYIKYCGLTSPNNSVNILSHYFLLLFPTYYEGEGLAGTIIDAMFTGLPVIATDWHNNKEVIEDKLNGFLVPIQDFTSISNILVDIATAPHKLQDMRLNCIHTAINYIPSTVIQVVIDQLV